MSSEIGKAEKRLQKTEHLCARPDRSLVLCIKNLAAFCIFNALYRLRLVPGRFDS